MKAQRIWISRDGGGDCRYLLWTVEPVWSPQNKEWTPGRPTLGLDVYDKVSDRIAERLIGRVLCPGEIEERSVPQRGNGGARRASEDRRDKPAGSPGISRAGSLRTR
jgi:hypothetical protein